MSTNKFAGIFAQCDSEAIKAAARDSRSGDLPVGLYAGSLATITCKVWESDDQVSVPVVTAGFKIEGTLKGEVDCTDKMQFKSFFLSPPKEGKKESFGVKEFNDFYKGFFEEFPDPSAVADGGAASALLAEAIGTAWTVAVTPQKKDQTKVFVNVKRARS